MPGKISNSKSKGAKKKSTPRTPPARSKATTPLAATGQAGSRRVDACIKSHGGWRAELLAEVRRIIKQADPQIEEDCKWIKPTNPRGVPVWYHGGIVCTGEAYKQVVKLTFARGAFLKDRAKLFNASLDGNTRRAIDIREGDSLDGKALAELVQAAVKLNLGSSAAKAKPAKPRKGKKVVLLSGGNPQIAKAYGDAPVQEYIAAMPGWKRDVGRRLDEIIVRAIPHVYKAVKWNTPFYGIEGQGWFLGFHCITKYVKVAFFRGASLRPLPPVASKQKEVRYFHVREHDQIDEAQFAAWVTQASRLPGERM